MLLNSFSRHFISGMFLSGGFLNDAVFFLILQWFIVTLMSDAGPK